MYTARIENKNGGILTLTGDEPTYQVLSIVGLNPPRAQVNTTTIVGMDGAVFNSSKLETRNIVITVKINGDAEKNRLMLYRYFKTKEWCRFYYSNGTLDVSIDGYVESVECNYFSNSERAQISIICPYPYFRSVEQIINDLSAVQGVFEFPFAINADDPIPIAEMEQGRQVIVTNSSESECGCAFEISLTGDPEAITDITITNETTGEYISLDGTKYEGGAFYAPQKILINTEKGHKSVVVWDDGEEKNAFGTLRNGSTFIQLAVGDNEFSYTVVGGGGEQAVGIVISHYDVYRGV